LVSGYLGRTHAASMGVFRNVGWPVIPYSVDYSTTGDIEM
jgi:hypothetical protein